MLLFGNVPAQEDDYLMELEGAMEEVSPITDNPPIVVQEDTPAPPPVAPQHNEFLDEVGAEIEGMESPEDDAVPENARDQFDSDLQDRMPGTFVLYNRLSDDKKSQVFSEYEMSGDYLRVRRKIIELRRSN